MVDYHWADKAAQEVIDREDKETYVLASGITPSGVVHIGNFREAITTDLVARALLNKGKKVRFIYSWDDYDVFRKVPKNMPNQELLKTLLRKSIVDVPDTFDCKHESYAAHNEKIFEDSLPAVGISPKFIYQSKMYRASKYAKEMSYAMQNVDTLKSILNKYRTEDIDETWVPISIFCEKCGKDTTTVTNFDGKFGVSYTCECGFQDTFDLRKKGVAKLAWRVDWPMRWNYEGVDFEPGGKDHSSPGGSYDTGKDIVRELWHREPPLYVMYDFIILKGVGGKMSSSSGNVINLADVLEVYTPEIVRWMFASSRPNAEFAISFDLDVLGVYEEFAKCEQMYFGVLNADNDKEKENQKRIYELSVLKIPKKLPEQVTFRHLVSYVQMYKGDIDRVVKEFKSKDIRAKAICAWNWSQKYAPDDLKFTIQETVSQDIKNSLSSDMKKAIQMLRTRFESKKYTEQSLFDEFYKICQECNIQNKDFFKYVYLVLIAKERGPKLASLMLAMDKKEVLDLLGQV